MATEHVLNRARGDPEGLCNVADSDIALGIVVNERKRPAQLRRLRRFGGVHFTVIQHLGSRYTRTGKTETGSPRIATLPRFAP
jgi:hypothetical protein